MKKLRVLANLSGLQKGLALTAAAAVMAIPGMTAYAGGGAGSQPGDGTTPITVSTQWAYQDNNNGAFGGYDMASIYAAFGAMGVTMLPSGIAKAQAAMTEANTNCLNRFNESHPDQAGQGNCRVVSVGTMTGPNRQFSGMVHHTKNDWMNAWANTVVGNVYSNHGVQYTTNAPFFDQPGTSVNTLADQYTNDSTTIVVIMLNQYEPRPADIPPAPPTKDVPAGTNADSMQHDQVIKTGTGTGGKQLAFTDYIDPAGQDYRIVAQRVEDRTTGQDISAQFDFDTANGSRPAGDQAHATWKGGDLPNEHEFWYTLTLRTLKPEISRIKDHGEVHWKGTSKEQTERTPEREFPTWRPNPDKSWIFREPTTGKWQAVIDPGKTNGTGADDHTFLDGDKVGGVVNGTVDPGLIEAPAKFQLTDDWSAAEYLVDQEGGAAAMRVYEADGVAGPDGHYRQSDVADIINQGRDVTSLFDISMQGSKAVATAKPAYLAKLKGMARPLQVTLLVPFTINFADGKGAEQVRKDAGKQPGDELTFCQASAGSAARFTNKGSETVNDQEVPTNEPQICGYVPPVSKDVIGESSEGGDQSSVNGKTVYPGQKVEYQLDTQPKLPANLAYGVRSVSFTDSYDAFLKVDKQTLELMDLGAGKVIPKSKYTTKWDDSRHLVVMTITDSGLIGQWRAAANPRIQLRFEGTVSADAPADHKIGNQWMLTLNNSITPSNIVFNTPPDFTPGKQDVSSKDKTVSIDGKTLLLGDTGVYRVTMDAHQTGQAYKVWRLGIVDDYDERYLQIDQTRIEVVGSDGKDYTKAFNIRVLDGVVYAFARTVDTPVPAIGETLKGDPQPEDLKAYAESQHHDPLKDPAIDQSLLGREYELVMPYKVIKVSDGYTVKNTATQIINGSSKVTNTVSNPLKPINPSKDVVVKVNGESANGHSIYKDSLFLYQLDSSILPANRAYAQVDQWRIEDQLDPSVDQYTGQWAVYAARDLYQDGRVLAAKGDRIAGSGFDSTALGGALFELAQDPGGKVTIQATARYRDLVGRSGEREAGWRVFLQCKRIKTTERHENRFTEYYNDKTLPSNIVWTKTPDMTPSIAIEKWDRKSGWPAGDRDDPKDALHMDGDTEIVFTITNTSKTDPDTGKGALYRAKDLKLEDSTIVGDGTVVDISYPDGWDSLVLKPGESVDVHGMLKGVTSRHTDRAKVTGKPLTPCPVEGPKDPFGDPKPGKPSTPQGTVAIDGVTYCEDTPVESNVDDWNGLRESLAVTGADAAGIVVAALVLALGGVALLIVRRCTSRPSDQDAPSLRAAAGSADGHRPWRENLAGHKAQPRPGNDSSASGPTRHQADESRGMTIGRSKQSDGTSVR